MLHIIMGMSNKYERPIDSVFYPVEPKRFWVHVYRAPKPLCERFEYITLIFGEMNERTKNDKIV